MNEVIIGIRIIKMYVWEKLFVDFVINLRKKEIFKILRSFYFRGMNLVLFFSVSKIIVFVIFIIYVFFGNVIIVSCVFVVVILYGVVWLMVIFFFFVVIEKVLEVIISI